MSFALFELLCAHSGAGRLPAGSAGGERLPADFANVDPAAMTLRIPFPRALLVLGVIVVSLAIVITLGRVLRLWLGERRAGPRPTVREVPPEAESDAPKPSPLRLREPSSSPPDE